MENANRYWDTETVIKEIPTGERTFIRISLVTKKGKTYVNYREWYNTKADPTYYPSKHGGALPIEMANDFANAIKEACK